MSGLRPAAKVGNTSAPAQPNRPLRHTETQTHLSSLLPSLTHTNHYHTPPPPDQADQLRQEFNIDIRVLGIADSKHMLTSESGIDLEHWREGECRVGWGVCMRVSVTEEGGGVTQGRGQAAHAGQREEND